MIASWSITSSFASAVPVLQVLTPSAAETGRCPPAFLAGRSVST
jgi:hypothetical protein